jgi:hypothetical protein
MPDQLCRITVKNASINSVADVVVVTGYVVHYEPEPPPHTQYRDILRPLEPDEPNSETEIGYSRSVLEPLTIIHKNRKAVLTKTLFMLFRYVYDIYRAEGRNEFDFVEIAEALRGDECEWTKNAIEKAIRRLAESLAKILSPISVRFNNETLYVDANFGIPN